MNMIRTGLVVAVVALFSACGEESQPTQDEGASTATDQGQDVNQSQAAISYGGRCIVVAGYETGKCQSALRCQTAASSACVPNRPATGNQSGCGITLIDTTACSF